MTFHKESLPDPLSYCESQGLRVSPRGEWRDVWPCFGHEGSKGVRMHARTGAFARMVCGVKGGDVLAFHMQAHGMEFVDAARQLGAWTDDGKAPPRQTPAPLSPRAALQVIALESTLAAVAAGNVAHGVKLADRDRFRLLTAAARINRIADFYK